MAVCLRKFNYAMTSSALIGLLLNFKHQAARKIFQLFKHFLPVEYLFEIDKSKLRISLE